MKKTSLIILCSSLLLPQAIADDGVKKIEVIEVKAQKRTQNINDVAISLSIIEGKSLSDQNIKDTTALSGQSANFKITPNAAEGTPPAINIRGVGSMDYNTSTTSPVGVYIDNIAGGSANSQLVNLYDIDSIEILKGPQGTNSWSTFYFSQF
ncbi:Plug domain-containing protein [Pseudoalteromonas sp. NBT06-2]|uniref:TonB-dependent receptor plug domain-containing protein n=1 Tax=Pseudoalteromonas sp. NBT06-2 TaxID=2025950 RepID=UPI0014820368|nr:Plug domain-containing protein [Pseudoalteromonas sp. NBT06-2]